MHSWLHPITLSFPFTFGPTSALSLRSEGDARPTMLCALLSTVISSESLSASGNELHQTAAHMTVAPFHWMRTCLWKQAVTNGSQPNTGTHLQGSMWAGTDGAEGEDVGGRTRNRGSSTEGSTHEEGWKTQGMKMCWADRINKKRIRDNGVNNQERGGRNRRIERSV